jgi:hypothetical protein
MNNTKPVCLADTKAAPPSSADMKMPGIRVAGNGCAASNLRACKLTPGASPSCFGHLHVVWVSSNSELGVSGARAVMWQVRPQYGACPDFVAKHLPRVVSWVTSDTNHEETAPGVCILRGKSVASPTLYEACPNATSVTYMDLTQQIPRPWSCEVCYKGNRTHKAG